MGKLIVFLIFGFMAFAVLKQLLRVVRFFEPKQQQPQQKRSPEQETPDVPTPEVVSAMVDGSQDWAEEIKRSYDLFKTGALTKEEFEQVKAQVLARVGAEA
ncbi:hypothetical protein R70006_03763 [Paraburkholderia domus]|uniref:hypothetical protein n=1 Tax=Paraburkholderia domus TaxID=2793075 RepID=UPI001911A52F|nr:hypothetical protein [Paraburkholderia domus]MBK5047232.1 hypothetical protein [Burkholderia sp. R-70006]CAE6767037.1 hypothetical protein R70006_03763 [Paraburkholderia domus]